jgi:hypothetical protein
MRVQSAAEVTERLLGAGLNPNLPTGKVTAETPSESVAAV